MSFFDENMHLVCSNFMNALESWFLTFTKSNFFTNVKNLFHVRTAAKACFQHFVKVLRK